MNLLLCSGVSAQSMIFVFGAAILTHWVIVDFGRPLFPYKPKI